MSGDALEAIREMNERRQRLACPDDPVAAAMMALDLVSRASPGPWHVCRDGECSCKTVWSGAEYPIASLKCGEWGDQYPSWRLLDADNPELPGTKVIDAYMERLTYGSIPEHYARADARFIVFARMALPLLAAEIIKLQAMPPSPTPKG